jgi:hypothetical protein
MSPLGNQIPENRGVDWLGIARTLLLQVLVLFALSGALIRYLNWSSDAAWAEFSAASTSAAPGAKPLPRSSTPVRAVNDQAPCAGGM